MAFSWGKRSLKCLDSVHPHLKMMSNVVITRTEFDIGIYAGDRTIEKAIENVKTGVSKTYNSRHLHKCAIDFICYRPDFKGKEFEDIEGFRYVADLYKEVASEMGLMIEWGGDWKSWQDYPHLQLPHSEYPDYPEILAELRERGLIT